MASARLAVIARTTAIDVSGRLLVHRPGARDVVRNELHMFADAARSSEREHSFVRSIAATLAAIEP